MKLALAGACLMAVMAVTSGCASATPSPVASAQAAPESPATASDQAAAESYCTEKGGQLVDRTAIWNTNADPPAWLTLAGRLRLCEFESGTGENPTRISVDLTTLYSEQPTIAAVAYLSKVRAPQPAQVGQNPAEYSCMAGLDGTSAFGNTATVGGWVDTGQPVFTVMNLCVFADLSAIDEFGVWYYANGTVRGADLAPLMRYQPNGKLPAMFGGARP
jgi:putative hemolysin